MLFYCCCIEWLNFAYVTVDIICPLFVISALVIIKVWKKVWKETRLESLFSARGRYFSPSNLRAWKNRPHISFPYEMVYFSSILFRFCALDWSLRAWQFACARKIFSAHYILFSLGRSLVRGSTLQFWAWFAWKLDLCDPDNWFSFRWEWRVVPLRKEFLNEMKWKAELIIHRERRAPLTNTNFTLQFSESTFHLHLCWTISQHQGRTGRSSHSGEYPMGWLSEVEKILNSEYVVLRNVYIKELTFMLCIY